jgi:hypothetical protein
MLAYIERVADAYSMSHAMLWKIFLAPIVSSEKILLDVLAWQALPRYCA